MHQQALSWQKRHTQRVCSFQTPKVIRSNLVGCSFLKRLLANSTRRRCTKILRERAPWTPQRINSAGAFHKAH